jgi:hypothetical protein
LGGPHSGRRQIAPVPIVSYNASAVNNYNAASSQVRFESKNIFFYFGKRLSLLQRWCCSCKFTSRKIGSPRSLGARSSIILVACLRLSTKHPCQIVYSGQYYFSKNIFSKKLAIRLKMQFLL